MNRPLAAIDLDHVLASCQELWSEFRQQRLFMTGGTGFFGCWLLESFVWANDKLALNAQITVLSRDPAAFYRKMPHLAHHPAIVLLQGDVRDFEFPQGVFSHVIHAATEASASLNRDDPLKMLEVIVQGTQHTLDFAVSCRAKKVLLASSGAIYGRQPPELSHVPETFDGSPDLSNPANAYGIGKRTAEHMAQLYQAQHGLAVKIARCFAFVGPHLPLDTHFAIGNFIQHGLNRETLHIKGDGTPYRSYQYAADLTIWLWHILVRGEVGCPYNVGSDQACSIAELAQVVAECFDANLRVEIAGKPLPGALAERYVPSIDRARKTLGLTNKIDLSESLKRTIAWHASSIR